MIRKFLGEEGGLTLSLSSDRNWGKPRGNSRSVFQHLQEVGVMIDALIKSGRIVETDDIALSSPISVVPKPDGSLRLIHDLRRLNKRLRAPKFKLPSVFKDLGGIPKDAFMFSFDLKNAYYNVPLHPDFQKYFGFSFKKKSYRWTSMPFGMNIAPWVWQKIAADVIRIIKQEGIPGIVYLDDFLFWTTSYESAVLAIDKIKDIFKSLGLRYSEPKSVLIPTKRIKFLGFILDSRTQEISLSTASQATAASNLSDIKAASLPAFVLASYVGYIQYISQLWPMANSLIRPWYPELRQGWDPKANRGKGTYSSKKLRLSDEFIPVLERLVANNVPRSWTSTETDDQFHVYSDATPWQGGWINQNGDWAAFDVGAWTDNRIFFTEVEAGLKSIHASLDRAHQPVIHLHIDNQGAAHCLRHGSSRFDEINTRLALLADRLSSTRIRLAISYIRSEYNPADHFSRDPSLVGRAFCC
jgi:hypothetical protein